MENMYLKVKLFWNHIVLVYLWPMEFLCTYLGKQLKKIARMGQSVKAGMDTLLVLR